MFENLAVKATQWLAWALPWAVLAAVSLTFHEYAHGYVAYKLGDPTAKNYGRLTLNPIPHIDVLGFLSLMIFHFGWAKPVPVNPMYFRNRKKGEALVSFAGPLANLVLAFIFALVYYPLSRLGANEILLLFMWMGMTMNISLAVFNLLPVPPLDGFKIVGLVMPENFYYDILRFEMYGMIILMFLIWTNVLTPVLTAAVSFLVESFLKIASVIFSFM